MEDIELLPPDKPYDKSFRFIGTQYGKDLHINLEVPGKFIRLLQNDVVTHNNLNLRMDLLELAGPDNISIHENTVINLEHQSTLLDQKKLKVIADYKDYSKCRHHLPVLSIVVTPHDPENQQKRYESTKSDITQPQFIYIDDNEIKIRLNNLENKIINNCEINNFEVLDFAIIAIFVKQNKNEILEKLCNLYKDAKQIKGPIRNNLSIVLDWMVKTHFKGNKEKILELKGMFSEELETARNGMKIYYEEEFAKINAQHTKEISQKNIELTQKESEIKELETERNGMKIYYEDEFAKLNDQHTKEISQKNIELTEKESQLTEKDSKIKKLEKQRKHYKDTIDELKENGTLDESTYNIINSVFE